MIKLLVATIILSLVLLAGCSPDPCEQKIIGEGECHAVYQGFEYDATSNSCIIIKIEGCTFDRPFDSAKDCQDACIQ